MCIFCVGGVCDLDSGGGRGVGGDVISETDF